MWSPPCGPRPAQVPGRCPNRRLWDSKPKIRAPDTKPGPGPQALAGFPSPGLGTPSLGLGLRPGTRSLGLGTPSLHLGTPSLPWGPDAYAWGPQA